MSLLPVFIPVNENAEKFTLQDFTLLWYHATSARLMGTYFDDPSTAAVFYTGLAALTPGARSVILTNSLKRSDRKAPTRDSVHIHGEYGFAYIESTGIENPASLWVSASWGFSKDHPEVFQRAIDLLRECLRLHLPMGTLIHWFDTMSRLTNGKRTSPNFCPEKSFNKIAHRAMPMIELLNANNWKYTAMTPR